MFDNGTMHSAKALEMAMLIPKPIANDSDSTHLLPSFCQMLQLKSGSGVKK